MDFYSREAISIEVWDTYSQQKISPHHFQIKVATFTTSNYTQLVLCDSEKERNQWVGMLQELLQLYNKNHGINRSVSQILSSS